MTQFLQNAVYGTVMIAAVALLRRVLKDRLAPGARLALWAVCLFRLLTPIAPASVLSLWGLFGQGAQDAPAPEPAPAPSGTGMYLPAPDVNAPAVMIPDAAAPAAVEVGIPWETVVMGIWLAVGLALAARYALSYFCTRRAVAGTVLLGRDDPRYQALPRCARLREGPMEGAPLTFGALRPTVVLPPGLSGDVLECVLAHEGVHARRRDNLWHYVTAAALAAYWWNPAVWLMSRLLRRDVELSCDRAALERLGPERRADYAQALVSMATQADGPAFCQTFGRKAAEERILSVMKYKKMTVIGAALTLALVLAVSVGFASNPAADVPDEDSTTSSAPSTNMWSMRTDADDNLKYFSINLDFLEENLAKHVADGSMIQVEADRVLERARELSKDGVDLSWNFPGDSGLVFNRDLVVNANDFAVCYKTESGELVPVDPATVVNGFILNGVGTVGSEFFDIGYAGDTSPETQKIIDALIGMQEQANSGGDLTVEYYGHTYARADLSQETLDWLDWYLSLPEESQMAISMVPPELIPALVGSADDANAGEDLPTYVEPAQAGEPAGTVGSEFYDYRFVTSDGVATGGGMSVYVSVTDPARVVDLDGYRALLDQLTADGKVSQEDADWLYAGAKQAIEQAEKDGRAAVIHTNSTGSYAIFPAPVCTWTGCADTGVHTHNGLTYNSKHDYILPYPAFCTDESCTISGEHHHEGDTVVHHYSTLPASTACPVEGCTETLAHQHDGRWYCFAHPVCAEEGCTIMGDHTHNGVAYSCNGAGHSGGVCDGSCNIYFGNGANAAPTANGQGNGYSYQGSSHHSESHSRGHHSGHH